MSPYGGDRRLFAEIRWTRSHLHAQMYLQMYVRLLTLASARDADKTLGGCPVNLDEIHAFGLRADRWRRESIDCDCAPFDLEVDQAVVLLATHDHPGALREACRQRRAALAYLQRV